MNNYSYTIYANPAVKKNNQKVVWTGRYPKKINTKAYTAWANEARLQLMTHKRPSEPISEPINLQCRFYMRTRGRVDLSALYEGIQDILVEMGVLADDNYKIVASHDGSGVFYDKENPRTEVVISDKIDAAYTMSGPVIKPRDE